MIITICMLIYNYFTRKIQQFVLNTKMFKKVKKYHSNAHAQSSSSSSHATNNKLDIYKFQTSNLELVDYKSYRGIFGEGIHTYPLPRSGHRIVCNDTHIFCFGGFNPDVTTRGPDIPFLFNEIWKYNIFTRKWTIVLNKNSPNMPKEVASSAIEFKDNILFIFGGTGYPFGYECSNECYIYLPYSSRNKSLVKLQTTGNKPLPQYGQAILYADGYLYAIGGTTGFDYSCDVYRLNVIEKNWECLYKCENKNIERNNNNSLDEPVGRYRHGLAFDGTYIYVIGGGKSDFAYDLEEIPAFNVFTNKWRFFHTKGDDRENRIRSQYPAPRKCHSCVQIKSDMGEFEVIISGGISTNSVYYNDIWKLNLTTLQWMLERSTLPNPIYFHDAATSGNGLMHIFGGIELNQQRSTTTRTNNLYRVWATLPKLSEICFSALLHYKPELAKCSLKQLLTIGIPNKFANRIEMGNWEKGMSNQ